MPDDQLGQFDEAAARFGRMFIELMRSVMKAEASAVTREGAVPIAPAPVVGPEERDRLMDERKFARLHPEEARAGKVPPIVPAPAVGPEERDRLIQQRAFQRRNPQTARSVKRSAKVLAAADVPPPFKPPAPAIEPAPPVPVVVVPPVEPPKRPPEKFTEIVVHVDDPAAGIVPRQPEGFDPRNDIPEWVQEKEDELRTKEDLRRIELEFRRATMDILRQAVFDNRQAANEMREIQMNLSRATTGSISSA